MAFELQSQSANGAGVPRTVQAVEHAFGPGVADGVAQLGVIAALWHGVERVFGRDQSHAWHRCVPVADESSVVGGEDPGKVVTR